jgi:flagellar biosynthesis component FlhA
MLSGRGNALQMNARGVAESLPALMVVAAVAAVLVPLPSPAIDALATLSLAGSLVVLVAALIVDKPSDFLPFPPLVLLLTVGRLALNLSTTRAILTRGEAGHVIDSFASLVIRGEIVVGLVMFSIIAAVQYLVIVRGSERAAEVGARFALDALPGQQAAIEADLRAALIHGREAASRRARLSERSDFFGRMDGAMRFVKGEALVGLVIVAINAFGGTLLGTFRDHLPLMESVNRYVRLTIGDGLATQVPALLVSIAAGILVARVERQKAAWDLAWLKPAMLAWPGLLLAALVFIDGMPRAVFSVAATVLIGSALLVARRRPQQQRSDAPLWIELPRDRPERVRDLLALFAPFTNRIAASFGVRPIEVSCRLGAVEKGIRLRYREHVLWRSETALSEPSEQWLADVSRALIANIELWIDAPWFEARCDAIARSDPGRSMSVPAAIGSAGALALLRAWARERLALPDLAHFVQVLAEIHEQSPQANRAARYELLREAMVLSWLPDRIDEMNALKPVRHIRLSPDAEEALASACDLESLPPRFHARVERIEAWRSAIAKELHADCTLIVTTTSRVRLACAELIRPLGGRIAAISTREWVAAGWDIRRLDAAWIDFEE